jgi:hypothetical protein
MFRFAWTAVRIDCVYAIWKPCQMGCAWARAQRGTHVVGSGRVGRALPVVPAIGAECALAVYHDNVGAVDREGVVREVRDRLHVLRVRGRAVEREHERVRLAVVEGIRARVHERPAVVGQRQVVVAGAVELPRGGGEACVH